MGFSPGDFHAKIKGEVVELHWELKDGGRIVLWDEREFNIILELDLGNAALALTQLETLVGM